MSRPSGDCPLCRGGVKRPGRTTFTVDLGFGVVVMRNVPAQVCDQCGSDWIEDKVAEKLEQVVELARKKTSSRRGGQLGRRGKGCFLSRGKGGKRA